jgi:hypothetical protein
MPSADQVPVKNPHSTMRWHKWVVLTAGSTGSALRAVRPPNLHITPAVRRDHGVVGAAPDEGRRHRACQQAGEKLGIDFEVIDVSTPEQPDQVLARPLAEHRKTARFLPLDGLFIARRAQIAEFALRQKAALFASFREDAEAGALMTFGFNLDTQLRLGAGYVDQILKGARPANLPVQPPSAPLNEGQIQLSHMG